jgi:serine/threonine protein kinase
MSDNDDTSGISGVPAGGSELAGVLLAGRHRLGSLLGAGGMGEVWRARDEQLDRNVAVKVFRAPHGSTQAEQDELIARFRQEARAAARLDSPRIVAVYDHGTAQLPGRSMSTPYLVMALVRGRTLQEVLADLGRVPVRQALGWVRGICQALAAAHAAGIVHRDVKPANVMVDDNGEIKVLDFGIAGYLEASASELRLTRTGEMPFGSVLYLAPERFDAAPGDARTDLYALGCVLYELLTGRPPFTGTAATVLRGHLTETALRPSRLRRDVPERVDRLVMALLRKDPEQRPGSAEEVAAAVAELLEGGGGVDAAAGWASPGAELAAADGEFAPQDTPPGSEPEDVRLVGAEPEPESKPESESKPRPARTRRRLVITVAAGVAVAALVGGTVISLSAGSDRGGPDGGRPSDNVSIPVFSPEVDDKAPALPTGTPNHWTIGVDSGYTSTGPVIDTLRAAVDAANRSGRFPVPIKVRTGADLAYPSRGTGHAEESSTVAVLAHGSNSPRETKQLERAKLATVNPCGAELSSGERRDFPINSGFRITADSSTEGYVLAQYLKSAGVKSVRIIRGDTLDSDEAPRSARLIEALQNSDIEVATSGDGDPAKKAPGIVGSDPEAVIVDGDVFPNQHGSKVSWSHALASAGFTGIGVTYAAQAPRCGGDSQFAPKLDAGRGVAEGWLTTRVGYDPARSTKPALSKTPSKTFSPETRLAADAILKTLEGVAADTDISSLRAHVTSALKRAEIQGYGGKLPLWTDVPDSDRPVWLDEFKGGRWRERGLVNDLIEEHDTP